MRDLRDSSKAWSIVEMALGGILVVVAFSYMYLMITMPERATFDPDHFVVRATEREPPPSPLGWIISLCTPVSKPKPQCRACKRPVDASDAHCRHCGAKL